MNGWEATSAVALLEGLRAAAVVVMLGGAAVLDLKHRRVPNRYWLPFVAIAALGLLVDLWLHRAQGIDRVLVDDAVAAVVCGFFYALWRFRLFGGADAKGLMVVAAIMPRIPETALPIPAALGILALGSLFAAVLPLGLLAWNAAHGKLRMPAALVGAWMPVATARTAKVWPMEEPDGTAEGTPAWRIRVDFRLGTPAERTARSEARFAALEAAGRTHAWFAPQVPLVAFLFPGAVLWLWVRTIPLPPL